jgi:hypothetical protein
MTELTEQRYLCKLRARGGEELNFYKRIKIGVVRFLVREYNSPVYFIS